MQQFVYYLKYVLRDHYMYYFFQGTLCLTFLYVYIICVNNHVWLLPFFLQLEISRTASSVQGECQQLFGMCSYVVIFFVDFYMLINHLLKKKRWKYGCH